MGRAFVYVVLGGGVAAGYAALEFANKGVAHGELCFISDEPVIFHPPVAPYERPALSKGFLLPEDPARLPEFHTCVGANEERLTPKWYKEHGIELILNTRIMSADVRRNTLLTAAGETISYKFLIIATGARALKLEEFGVSGSDAENVCHLRDLADATRLVDLMQASTGGNAVVIGGGYIGMEVAASLVINKINVTMVFPEPHCMARLFTPKIASFYEDFYKSKGVNFVKGTVLSSFIINPEGKVTGVNLKDGSYLPADLVVVGIGIRPNTSLFEGQLTLEKGGIKVNSQAFSFSWQFYGENLGEAVYFGDFSGTSFGAYWVHNGHLVGSFLEGGSKEAYEALAKVTRLRPAIDDLSELERQGLGFVVTFSKKQPVLPIVSVGRSTSIAVLEKPVYPWHAAAGVVAAASIAAFAYWYGRRRRR
ncbi:hypothetical protein M8C21_014690, partial [Ambrosia artemisiifolia]